MYREYVLRQVASELDDSLTSGFLNSIADHVNQQYDTEHNIIERDSQYIQRCLNEYIPDFGSGVDRIPLDSTYYCAWRSDVKDFFAQDFTDEEEYVRQEYDCENFAIQSMTHAQYRGFNNVGLVVDWSSKHAYNIAIYGGSNEPDLIEPQSDTFLDPGADDMHKLERGTIII